MQNWTNSKLFKADFVPATVPHNTTGSVANKIQYIQYDFHNINKSAAGKTDTQVRRDIYCNYPQRNQPAKRQTYTDRQGVYDSRYLTLKPIFFSFEIKSISMSWKPFCTCCFVCFLAGVLFISLHLC